MKKNERKAILVLVLIAAVVIAVIFFATRNKGEVQPGQTSTGSQTSSSSSSSGSTAKVVEKGEVTQTLSDGTVENTNEKVKETREINGFTVSEIEFFKEANGNTVFRADVKNDTGSDQTGFMVDVVVLDKAGNELGRIPAAIIDTVAGDSFTMRAEITEDYVNAYDVRLEAK